MEVKYTTYGTGRKKILITVDMINDFHYLSEIRKINKNNEYTFYFLDRNQYSSFFKFDIFVRISFRKLNNTYKKNEELKKYYKGLIVFIKKEKIKHILFFGWGWFWHPTFLQTIKLENIKIGLFTVDDDASTIKYCSLPYTKHYDYHFHVGVMYNKKGETIAKKLQEYGGNPVRIPFGYKADNINKNIDFENRDIEVCYIGNINPLKFFRISKLKRHFGDRLKLYGAQGNGDWKSLKGIFYKVCNKIFSLGYIEKVSDEKLLEIYRRTKIGFNLHLVPWKGPSNSRMYELPANGVMQLCDNELGISKTFEIKKDVISYKNIDDAIQKIEFYLKHNKDRIRIAKNGYRKTINNYSFENCFKIIINTMLN